MKLNDCNMYRKMTVMSASNSKCDAEMKVEGAVKQLGNISWKLYTTTSTTLADVVCGIVDNYALLRHPKLIEKVVTTYS